MACSGFACLESNCCLLNACAYRCLRGGARDAGEVVGISQDGGVRFTDCLRSWGAGIFDAPRQSNRMESNTAAFSCRLSAMRNDRLPKAY